jgi:hypothetical protein
MGIRQTKLINVSLKLFTNVLLNSSGYVPLIWLSDDGFLMSMEWAGRWPGGQATTWLLYIVLFCSFLRTVVLHGRVVEVVMFYVHLVLTFVVVQVSSYNYCTITTSHTLCGYNGPKASCGKTYARGLTQTEKLWVLEYHNKLRSKVAMGYTAQPSASNMMELRWDNELAWVAQGLADTCKFGHDCSKCRSVSRFRVGQNLYQSYKSRSGPREWKAALDAWFHSLGN